MKGTVFDPDGTVLILECHWNHTNGCRPSPSFLTLCRKRSGYYFKNLSMEKKIGFQSMIDSGASTAELKDYIQSVLPANVPVDMQMVMNWRVKCKKDKALQVSGLGCVQMRTMVVWLTCL